MNALKGSHYVDCESNADQGMILSLMMITMTMMMMMMIIVWARRVPIVGVPMGTGWLSSSQKGAAAHTRDTPRTVERGKGKRREKVKAHT